MIKFTRDGSKVKIAIEHGIFGNEQYFDLEIIQSADYQAELLKQAMRKHLDTRIEAIRREAYNKGWKDKSSHKMKQTWFSNSIQNTNC